MSSTHRSTDRDHLVRIYIDDHWAGSAAGVALARRLADENLGTPWHAELVRIANEIDDDRQQLGMLREPTGSGPVSLKQVVAVASERLARLKLNGRLIGYSPLSRVLELELLMSGVQAKHRLWRAWRVSGEPLGDLDLDSLERRAEAQLVDLGIIHDQAALLAFADDD